MSKHATMLYIDEDVWSFFKDKNYNITETINNLLSKRMIDLQTKPEGTEASDFDKNKQQSDGAYREKALAFINYQRETLMGLPALVELPERWETMLKGMDVSE